MDASGFCYTTYARPSLGTALGCPVVALCGVNAAALGLQYRSLQVLQKITDGVDTGVGQHITLVLGLGNYRVGHLADFLLSKAPG